MYSASYITAQVGGAAVTLGQPSSFETYAYGQSYIDSPMAYSPTLESASAQGSFQVTMPSIFNCQGGESDCTPVENYGWGYATPGYFYY